MSACKFSEQSPRLRSTLTCQTTVSSDAEAISVTIETEQAFYYRLETLVQKLHEHMSEDRSSPLSAAKVAILQVFKEGLVDGGSTDRVAEAMDSIFAMTIRLHQANVRPFLSEQEMKMCLNNCLQMVKQQPQHRFKV